MRNHCTNRFAACALLAGALVFASRPAHAQRAMAHPAVSYRSGGGASAGSPITNTSDLAFVGGTSILRIRTSWAGYDPHRRAMIVQERVNRALSVGPVHPGEITVGRVQGDWCVLFRGRRFLTADPRTARLDRSNPRALAARWAQRMRRVIPALTYPTG